MGGNKSATVLVWNIRPRLTHDNTNTPSLLIWLQLKHMHKVSTYEQVSQLSPELESD